MPACASRPAARAATFVDGAVACAVQDRNAAGIAHKATANNRAATTARRIEAPQSTCELGVRLVERLSRAYRLTSEGERMHARIQEVAAAIDAIARQARSVDARTQRTVRVNGPPTIINRFLAPRLLRLQREQPGLRIELVGESRPASLSRGETDLALRLSRPHEKGIVARRLATIAYGLYGSRAYLDRCGDEPRDFLGFDDSLDHLPQQRWLRLVAKDRPLAVQANDVTVLLKATQAGLGVAVLPCIMVRADPNLVDVPTGLPPLHRELWLLFHRDIGRVPAVRVVIDRITVIATEARAAFLGEPATERASEVVRASIEGRRRARPSS